MKKNLTDKNFVKKPFYPGGMKAMKAFLAKEKKYPQEALEKGIEGTVHIRYTIDRRGRVIKTQVIAGLGHGCDEEAQRVVGLLRFEVPPTRKVKVQYHKTIHIHFKLPTQQTTRFVYTQSKEGDRSEDTKEDGSSYHYQIRW